MKKNSFLSILMLILMTVFVSCYNLIEKSEMGNISITIPSRAATSTDTNTSIDIDSLEFIITITNYETKDVINDIGLKGKTYYYELNPGFYDVVISAYLPSDSKTFLYEGKYEKVEIIAGKTSDIFITLKKKIEEPENPEEESKTWNINLSQISGDGYVGDNSKYGVESFSYYQSGAFNITKLFSGELPKAGDTVNLKWKAKSDSDIKNLYIIIVDCDKLNWTNLIPDEDIEKPVKQNIKANEEFEIEYSVKFIKTPTKNVKVYFSYGKNDAAGSSYLYQQEKSECFHSGVKIENGIVKINQPGSKFMEFLKSEGCDGYVLSLISGINKDGSSNYLSSRVIKFTAPDAFMDVDFNRELYHVYNSIQDGKIYSVVDYYKNVDDETQRIWITKDVSSTVDYNSIYEESDTAILGHKFGTSIGFGGATVSYDGTIEWSFEDGEEYPAVGWYVENLNLTEWDVIRIEFDSEYPDDSLSVNLLQDGCRFHYESDYQTEANVYEINLDGTNYSFSLPENAAWDISKPITDIQIRTHITANEGKKKAKVKSVKLKKYPQFSDHISVENVENGIQVTLKKANSSEIWLTSAVDIIEDGKDTCIPFSFIRDGEILINQSGTDTLSFVYPFTKAGSKYKFVVAPQINNFETVALIADKTSELQISKPEIISNFKVLYEEKDDTEGAKRIIKINSNPFETFSDVSAISYKLVCLNVFDGDYKWVYNFNVNENNVNEYIEIGKDFMSEQNELGKTPQEFKEAFNASKKLIINPHLEFNMENRDSSLGSFIISLGHFEYDWTVIE